MATTCRRTGVEAGECWCEAHGSDPEENARRRAIGEAVYEFRGGNALHVFLRAKTGNLVSLCNLRDALPEREVEKVVAKGGASHIRCEQCGRTLRSRTPNVRLKRYFAEQSAKAR